MQAWQNTYLPLVHVNFGTSSASSDVVSRMVVEKDLRVVDRAETTGAWRRDIVVRNFPPLLVARAYFAKALGFIAMQVCAARGILQGNGVRLVAILDGPFLFLAAVAFVFCDDA